METQQQVITTSQPKLSKRKLALLEEEAQEMERRRVFRDRLDELIKCRPAGMHAHTKPKPKSAKQQAAVKKLQFSLK